MNYFDEEVMTNLNNFNMTFEVLTEAEHVSIIRNINENVPFSGNKVAWDKLSASNHFGLTSSDLAISNLAKEVQKFNDNNLIFISDSACDEAYPINLMHIDKALSIFSEIPQHTYIVSKSLTWIACIASEGDLDFARPLLK
ncbi:hypothetical protein [Pseudomonas sp. MPB26]|uniref:hypothetical protein n=1 Tax=Pseudomonas sp. MPB26 TaxID=3388491 RepID=UPI0039847F88